MWSRIFFFLKASETYKWENAGVENLLPISDAETPERVQRKSHHISSLPSILREPFFPEKQGSDPVFCFMFCATSLDNLKILSTKSRDCTSYQQVLLEMNPFFLRAWGHLLSCRITEKWQSKLKFTSIHRTLFWNEIGTKPQETF